MIVQNFTENSAIAIIIEGTGKRVAESYNGSPSGAPEICIEYSLGGPLPIELLDFRAKAIDKNIVLDWTTQSELENDYFILQRSIDGINFENIVNIPGNGTTSELSKYHFVDRSPNVGINYYRLKQFDFNGSFSFSKIINASVFDKTQIIGYPSKVKNEVFVEWNAPSDQNIILTVNDFTGKVYKTIQLPANVLKTKLSLADLAAGAYFITVFDQNSIANFKIIKL